MIQSRRNDSTSHAIARLAHLLLLTALAWMLVEPAARAQDAPDLQCAVDPPQPEETVSLTGFPAERIYIHPKHPQLCGDPRVGSCNATAYVLAGDSLSTSVDCNGWTFVEFKGKKTTRGWIPSTRLTNTYRTAHRRQPVFAESMPPTRYPVCREVESIMNSALRDHTAGGYFDFFPLNPYNPKKAVLPSALQGTAQLDQLPDAVAADKEGRTWGGSVASANIQGQPLKAVAYNAGGTCFSRYLELWDPAFRKRVSVAFSNADSGEDVEGYSSEDLVLVSGQPYFAHSSRSGDVTLSSFNKDLSARTLCKVALAPSRVAAVRLATEPALCEAVRTGAVTGAPMQDIQPYEISPQSFRFDQLGATAFERASRLRVVARGRLDIDNDGKLDDVGLLTFVSGLDSAGCGRDLDAVVPIKLSPDGSPVAASTFNLKTIESAFSGEDGRLLVFRGKVYFESKSHVNNDGQWHVVVALSAGERKTMCEFLPVQYKAVDAN